MILKTDVGETLNKPSPTLPHCVCSMIKASSILFYNHNHNHNHNCCHHLLLHPTSLYVIQATIAKMVRVFLPAYRLRAIRELRLVSIL